jgi:fructose-bisphosphate aldolase/6-deoxy-5-ketofructose 1-phosphate synthase
MDKINVPLTVKYTRKGDYLRNYKLATRNTGRLMLFAGDQKIEHLNDDFFGKGIHTDDADPKHLFQIAAQAKIGVFAAQLGLLAKYAKDYKSVPYLVKLNSKTNLLSTNQRDPESLILTTVPDVLRFSRQAGLKIVGVGYTLYPGSEFEATMLAQAQQAIIQAHQAGLIVVLWIYPRGKAVKDERNPHLLAGMAGLACSLGADFVKITPPKLCTKTNLQEIIQAAGRTKVIFSGGSSVNPKTFLQTLKTQIDNGAGGSATGRNIHQLSTTQAIYMANAIAAIALFDHSVEDALKVFLGKKQFRQ